MDRTAIQQDDYMHLGSGGVTFHGSHGFRARH